MAESLKDQILKPIDDVKVGDQLVIYANGYRLVTVTKRTKSHVYVSGFGNKFRADTGEEAGRHASKKQWLVALTEWSLSMAKNYADLTLDDNGHYRKKDSQFIDKCDTMAKQQQRVPPDNTRYRMGHEHFVWTKEEIALVERALAEAKARYE